MFPLYRYYCIYISWIPLKENLMKKMYHILKNNKIVFTLLACLPALLFLYPKDNPFEDIKQTTFDKLEKVRTSKKQQVVEYFHEVEQLAGSILADDLIVHAFKTILQHNTISDKDLEFALDEHYIKNYRNFYDILFVDPSGFVFYSFKRESDYHKNLFTEDQKQTKLVKTLRNGGQFVEFEHYDPSGEPAAFFPVPIHQGEKQLGWVVLQCSTDKINELLLTDSGGFGRTGEVYLVNKDKLMLSDSRFMDDSTILRLKVDTEAVRDSLAREAGQKIIKDYRGVKVFSSFESFELFGAKWIIIAEIDEGEVITEHYNQHKKFFQKEIITYLAERPRQNRSITGIAKKVKRVNVNDYAKASPDTLLATYGVASCTAVAIQFPDKFSYLIHISPTDEIYISNSFTRYFLREEYQDFLSRLLERIQFYEVYPFELKKLQFVIIAPHTQSIAKAVDIILASGIELSNITFCYNPRARSANVLLDSTKHELYIEWTKGELSYTQLASETERLDSIVKKLMRYDGEPS